MPVSYYFVRLRLVRRGRLRGRLHDVIFRRRVVIMIVDIVMDEQSYYDVIVHPPNYTLDYIQISTGIDVVAS